jgi:hypothetical protein
VKFDFRQLLGEFHSAEMDVKELKKLIESFVEEAHPGDKIESFEINNDGLVDIRLVSGEEIEIEIDWNEVVLK